MITIPTPIRASFYSQLGTSIGILLTRGPSPASLIREPNVFILLIWFLSLVWKHQVINSISACLCRQPYNPQYCIHVHTCPCYLHNELFVHTPHVVVDSTSLSLSPLFVPLQMAVMLCFQIHLPWWAMLNIDTSQKIWISKLLREDCWWEQRKCTTMFEQAKQPTATSLSHSNLLSLRLLGPSVGSKMFALFTVFEQAKQPTVTSLPHCH